MADGKKNCCMCGEDVASRKRVKDAQGRYYCERCQAKARKAAQRVPVTAGASASAPAARADAGEVMLGDESRPVAPPAEGGEMDLAPVREAAPVQEEMFGCSVCKKLVTKRQITNVDGEFICRSCVARQNAVRQPTASGASKKGAATARSAGESGGMMKLLMFAGVCLLALVGAGVAAWMLPDMAHDIFFGVAIAGSVIGSLGLLWGIYAATSENVALRLACRFIPFVGLVVVIMRSVSDWETMKGPVITLITGSVVAAAGWVMWFGFIVLH